VATEEITCDPDASRRYQDALDTYYHERVLRPDGVCTCAHVERCAKSAEPNTFAAAQLSFVGESFAMRRNGHPWQIVIVSMQTGETESPITMARRRQQFAGRVSEQFNQRNAHIKGVTSALRVLWGREAGLDREGELLVTPGGAVHVLDAHALVNSTLCSSIITLGSRAGQGSDVMHRNCTEHLRAVLKLLEPTVVHSQGRRADEKHPTPHRSLVAAFDAVEWQDPSVAIATLGSRRFVWTSLGHPSAKGNYAWHHPTSPYFAEFVRPKLQLAYELAIGLASN